MSKHWPVALLAALWCMHLAYKTGLRRGYDDGYWQCASELDAVALRGEP